jgi:ankyrin repeat protein
MAGDMPQLAAQLRSGVSADCKDVKGQTALFYALSYQQTGVIEFLLARGAHINIRDNAGETLLREAEDAAFMAKTSGLGQKSADELVTLIKAHGGTR